MPAQQKSAPVSPSANGHQPVCPTSTPALEGIAGQEPGRTTKRSAAFCAERSAPPLDAGPASADEPALMALMAQLSSQYKSADGP
jgi:hypothetical protein